MSQYILDSIKQLDLRNDEDLSQAVSKVQELSQLYSRSMSQEQHQEFMISDPNTIQYTEKEQSLIQVI